jgi:hypothetical protein
MAVRTFGSGRLKVFFKKKMKFRGMAG